MAFNFTRKVIIGPQMEETWFYDIPSAERIYSLLLDIYLVRELRLYNVEEDLFAKLVFVIRSRELFIEFTRPFYEKPRRRVKYEKISRRIRKGSRRCKLLFYSKSFNITFIEQIIIRFDKNFISIIKTNWLIYYSAAPLINLNGFIEIASQVF